MNLYIITVRKVIAVFIQEKNIVNHIAKKVLEESEQASRFEKRVSNEISNHRKEMLDRRKKFNLLRNK